MNIRDFAASKGKSKQRVYQLIKEAGLKVSDLTDAQGQITESGLRELNDILPDKIEVPEGESETEQSSGSEEKQTKESGSDQQALLDTIKNLSASLEKAHEHIDKLIARLEQEQINLSQEQHLHAITKQELHDLQLRLTAGSPEGESDPQPVPADGDIQDPSQETEESEKKQDSPQNEDKPDLEGESPEEKKQDPEKIEGETAPAAESSSPVTTAEKQDQKPEQKKPTFRQRLHYLFHGE